MKMYGDPTYALIYMNDERNYIIETELWSDPSVKNTLELGFFLGLNRGKYLKDILNIGESEATFYYIETEKLDAIPTTTTIMRVVLKDIEGTIHTYKVGDRTEKYGQVESITKNKNEITILTNRMVKVYLTSESEVDAFETFSR